MTIPGKKQWEFTSFPETFLITSFSMSIGMIYPNPATDKWRLLAIPFALLSVSPVSVFISIEMLKLWNNGEILELMRHTAMFLPFFAGFMKMCLMYYRRVEAKKIIDIINHDYAYYNNLPDDYKAMVAASIKSSHIYINIWAACVMVIFAVFVGTASLLNIVSHLFMQEPKRYMIYDINMPGRDPEERFNSPYFEIMYFYTIYVALMYVLSFTGYDGLMIASVNHACLRQNIFTRQVQEAMGMRGERLRRKMADAVKDQVEALRLIDYVQTTFNIYLGYMYVIVLVEMVICIYLTNEDYNFDFQYTCLSFGTILHIYVPCMIADKLKCTCEDTAVRLYCCGWENMYDLRVRRCLPFMIARAQCPVTLKAFGLLTYEMDLFVGTMKSAYSMYTLLKTQQ